MSRLVCLLLSLHATAARREVQELIAQAFKESQAGDFDAAQGIFERVLKLQPLSADENMLHRSRRLDRALSVLEYWQSSLHTS